MLICPICKEKLIKENQSLKCVNNHSFDFSKEGYVNLLISNKNGAKTGDSRDSAHARHSFLAKGYYHCLKQAVAERMNGTVLDICCGEGYYDTYHGELYGFDISKEMVRLASKNNKEGRYFVANLASIPIESESIDTAIHLFAPFNEQEFSRILKKDGVLYSVIPGKDHLFEMKQIVYDTPYKNDEKAPETRILRLASRTRVRDVVSINHNDLKELFSMTPYFYRTSQENRSRLDAIDHLDLTVEFIILEYRK